MWYRPLFKDFVLAWVALVVIGLWYRPLTPIDETRAVTVAWEMWLRQDFLVPHLNGEAYSHKPPLLQWCIQLLWLVFGVSEWSARLVAPLFGLGNLYLARALARRLWPDDGRVERMVPWLLLAMPVWAIWTSLTLYDMMVTFFAQLGMLGVLMAAQGESRAGWRWVGLGIGGGLFAKGPVILVLILPTALFAFRWMSAKPAEGWGGWYRGMLVAIAIGAAVGLAWAIPAGLSGGEEYRRLIFWEQSAGRIANSFAHKRPFYWYFELLPLLLFPWFWWPTAWRAVRHSVFDGGQKFCAVQILAVLVVFSLFSGKQIHYLLPIFPAFALLLSRSLSIQVFQVHRWGQVVIGIIVALPGVAALILPFLAAVGGNVALQLAADEAFLVKVVMVAAGVAIALWPFATVTGLVRTLSSLLVAVLLAIHVGSEHLDRQFYDLQPFADRLAELDRANAPVAHWRKYNGEFQFLGRLRHPLAVLESRKVLTTWLQAHDDGYVVIERKRVWSNPSVGPEYAQYFRGSRQVELWRASVLRDLISRDASALE